jgi:hypothetical protein
MKTNLAGSSIDFDIHMYLTKDAVVIIWMKIHLGFIIDTSLASPRNLLYIMTLLLLI